MPFPLLPSGLASWRPTCLKKAARESGKRMAQGAAPPIPFDRGFSFASQARKKSGTGKNGTKGAKKERKKSEAKKEFFRFCTKFV
jgi:hypothetical protein